MEKICKHCKSKIDEKAKRCPKCQADLRIWPARHPILTGLALIIVLGIFTSGNGNKDNSNGANNNKSQVEATPVPEKISAKQLADEFDANQVAAEAKWEGKLVEFSAKITNITDTGLAFSNVASKDFSLAQISCKVDDKQQLIPLKNGQTVTVRGVVGTQMIGVISINDCIVVN